MKKARGWLAAHGVAYRFHDFRKDGVPTAHLDRWIAELGWEKLVNRQGTTWRKLGPDLQASANNAASARQLMLEYVSVIKRPVVEWGTKATVGFDGATWALLARGG